MNSRLTIIIISYRDRENLERCIESVISTLGELDANVIVFDNNSQDGTTEMVRSRFPQEELIESRENVGLTRGLNVCFGRSDGEYVLALDSDTIVTDGAIERLLSLISQHPDFAAVGGRLYYLDGSLQESARTFPSIINAFFGRHTLLSRLFPNNPFRKRYLMSELQRESDWFEADWVSAACMMISKKAYQAIDGFDEDFFVYWCDADFCYRARRAGYRVACVPTARITHCEQFRLGLKKSNRMIIDFHRGVYHFYAKNYVCSVLDPMRIVALVGLSIRAGILLAINALRPGQRRWHGKDQSAS